MREVTHSTERVRDGHGVHVRPVTSDDKEKLGDMFVRLSPQTIYRRLHMPYPRVPEWMIAWFADVAHHDGERLVAVAGDDIVGHAMYVGPDSGHDAEIALVVEDRWQSKGVGKLLLRDLADRAESRNIEAFTGLTLAENRRVLDLIGAVFSSSEYEIRDGSYYFRIPLREGTRKPDPWMSRSAA